MVDSNDLVETRANKRADLLAAWKLCAPFVVLAVAAALWIGA